MAAIGVSDVRDNSPIAWTISRPSLLIVWPRFDVWLRSTEKPVIISTAEGMSFDLAICPFFRASCILWGEASSVLSPTAGRLLHLLQQFERVPKHLVEQPIHLSHDH